MKSLFLAFSTLTCFPIPTGKATPAQLRTSVIFYPIVGALLGGLLALFGKIPLPSDLQAILALGAWVFLTLAFHLDGLGDCLDGWFGGHSPKERRRIMKDPTLGVYAVTGIVLTLLLKYVLLGHLFTQAGAWRWLIAIPAFARYSVVLACWITSPKAGEKGLGSQVLGIPTSSFVFSSLLTFPLVFLLGWPFAWLIGLSLLVSFSITTLSKDRIGGLTGDGMGAMIEISEITMLFLACSLFV